MLHVLASEIDAAKVSIKNQLFAKYVLTRFFILYILRLILEHDPGGKEVIENPEKFLANDANRAAFREAIKTILTEIITDIDHEIAQLGEDFDYRGKLRDEEWCQSLAHEIAATHRKLVERNRLEPFGDLYVEEMAQQNAQADSE